MTAFGHPSTGSWLWLHHVLRLAGCSSRGRQPGQRTHRPHRRIYWCRTIGFLDVPAVGTGMAGVTRINQEDRNASAFEAVPAAAARTQAGSTVARSPFKLGTVLSCSHQDRNRIRSPQAMRRLVWSCVLFCGRACMRPQPGQSACSASVGANFGGPLTNRCIWPGITSTARTAPTRAFFRSRGVGRASLRVA